MDRDDEKALAQVLAKKGSSDLSASARALVAYERVAALLTEAFELLLHNSSASQMRPQPEVQLATARHEELAHELKRALPKLARASEAVADDRGREQIADAFNGLRSGKELVQKLFARHFEVQEGKGRAGKRPWFERTERGMAVRPGYVREIAPPPANGFVHQTRLRNACEFIEELA